MKTTNAWMKSLVTAVVITQGAIAGCATEIADETSTSEGAATSRLANWRSEAQIATADQRAGVVDDFARRCVRETFSATAPHDGAPYKVTYHRCRPDGSATATFVVVPGTTESSVRYAEFVADWAKRGVELFILNNRGEGFNDRLLPNDPATEADESQRRHMVSFDHYVSDLRDFVGLVEEKAVRPERLMLVCHSMGGGICTRYAEVVPDNPFRGIMLSAPMQGIRVNWYQRWLAAAGATVRPEKWVPGGGPYDPNEAFEGNSLTASTSRFAMRHYINGRFPEIQLGSPTYGWVRGAVDATRAIQADAGRVRRPMLILSARADAIVDPASHDRVCAAIKRAGGSCTLVALEGSRHEVFIERDAIRNRAFDAMKDFMAGLEGGVE